MSRQPLPGTITTLAAQAKTRKYLGQRVNIFIDGKYSFALDILLIEKYKLARGTMISPAFLSQLLQEDGDAKARARALHFISYRPRAIGEVRARLKRDEWPDEVIERVLARLVKEKYLGDETFSSLWVETRSFSKPRGARMLRQELRQKGVDSETIDEALPDAEQELDNAVVALRPKLRLWRNLEDPSRREKGIQFLMRRGFNYGVAKTAWELAQEEA